MAAITSAQAERTFSGPSVTEQLVGMSHELRTPLNAVIGLSAILGRKLHGPLTDKQAEYVSQIEAGGRHLLALVDNMLDLAKAEAGKLRVDLTYVAVSGLIQESVALVRPLAVEKGLNLTVEEPVEALVTLIDPLRAKQVLINLLSNAVKFTDPGGSIGIRAILQADMVAIEVWDTGIGIPADQLDRVFEAFEQVELPAGRAPSGTGLGLPLSRLLAELQNGRVDVRSTEGEGSVFTAVFPCVAT